MKPGELHDLSEDKLREHIATSRRDVFGLRMQHATGELENTAGMRARKRDLARALTIARQRGVNAEVTVTDAGATLTRDNETEETENG
jgi:large subunit ribosomal protein L29